MRIHETDINRIKAEIDCRDFLKKGKSGNGYVCPVCKSGTKANGTGAVKYYEQSNTWHCFSCSEGGDIIDLYKHEYNKTFEEAATDLAEMIGIYIEPGETEHREKEKNMKSNKNTDSAKNTSLKANKRLTETVTEMIERKTEDYNEYYSKSLEKYYGEEGEPARAYMKKRGISEETSGRYFIGYDPEWVSPTTIKNLELKNNNWRPSPTRRIIIPVTDNFYIARDIDPAKDEAGKKYSKMNETGGGNMGIFNHEAIEEPKPEQTAVFITEGIFDALSIAEAELKGVEAVAINSTSNTGILLNLIKETLNKNSDNGIKDNLFIICLDNDESGRKATEKLETGFKDLGLSYLKADINCECNDPNDALVSDRERFIKTLKEVQHKTAAKPDNTDYYIENLLINEIKEFRHDIKTGFKYLDKKTNGIYTGLYVLASGSGNGKTTFVLQVAEQIAQQGKDVLFFSLEMSKLELITKGLARRTYMNEGSTGAVNSLSIRCGNITNAVRSAMMQYRYETGDKMNIIESNFDGGVEYIEDYVKRYIDRNNTRPVVIVDYLQILQPTDRKAGTKENVANNITALKRISRNMNIPVIVVCSVNRSSYLTPISFESLKEAGEIEYTADVIWGLQLRVMTEDDTFNEDDKKKTEKRELLKEAKTASPREIKLVCLKNRFGISSFEVNYNYIPEYDYFIEDTESNLNNKKSAKKPKLII